MSVEAAISDCIVTERYGFEVRVLGDDEAAARAAAEPAFRAAEAKYAVALGAMTVEPRQFINGAGYLCRAYEVSSGAGR